MNWGGKVSNAMVPALGKGVALLEGDLTPT
jgi:hypothetical protein